jgi:branched-chain amino acid transport system substrate-binding protein
MNNHKKGLAIAIVIVVGLVATFLIAGKKFGAKNQDTLKIGVLTALSGDVAEYGTNSLNGIRLAADEINDNGGVGGRQIQLFAEDTACDPTTAVSAFNKVVGTDGVRVILGTVCSGDVQAIMPLANQQGVVVFADGASSPSLTGAGAYFSRDYPSDAYEAQVTAGVIFGQLHKSNVAILYVNNDYGIAFKESFESTFGGLGGKVDDEEEYAQGATDFRTQLSKIKASSPDMLYLIGYPVDGGLAVKQARELGIKIPVFGSSGIKGDDFVKNGGDAAEGTFVADPASVDSPKRDAFTKDYQAKFGVQPGLTSDMGYDSLYVLAQALSGTTNIQEVAANLHKITGFDGASGELTINGDGDRTGERYDILVVKNGQFVSYAQ